MYNKIFAKIVDSSIWLEPHATVRVFVTFIAVMDEDGFVSLASPANVARRANATLDEAVTALAKLEGPDPDSSDPDNDGRRIERVPGGWIVLNAAKYRELATRATIRSSTRERVRKHRAKTRSVTDAETAGKWACAACCAVFDGSGGERAVQDTNPATGQPRGLICESCLRIVGMIDRGQSCNAANCDACVTYVARYAACNTPKRYNSVQKASGNGSVTQSDTDTETYTEAKAEALRDAGTARDFEPDDFTIAPEAEVETSAIAPAPRIGRRSQGSVFADGPRHLSHFGCGVLPSCHRGLCIPTFLSDGWLTQLRTDPTIVDPDEYLRVFIADVIRDVPPGPIGDDALVFWRAQWRAKHGTQAPAASGPKSRGDVTRDNARQVLEQMAASEAAR